MIRRSFLASIAAWLPGSALLAGGRPETTGELPPASLWSYTAIGGKPLVEQVYDRVLAVAAGYPDLSVSTLYYQGKTGEFLPNYVSIGTRVQFEFENGGRHPMTSVRMFLDDAEAPLVEVLTMGCAVGLPFFDYGAFRGVIKNPTDDSVDRAESILRAGLDALVKIEFPEKYVRRSPTTFDNELVTRDRDGVYRGRPSGDHLSRLVARLTRSPSP